MCLTLNENPLNLAEQFSFTQTIQIMYIFYILRE